MARRRLNTGQMSTPSRVLLGRPTMMVWPVMLHPVVDALAAGLPREEDLPIWLMMVPKTV